MKLPFFWTAKKFHEKRKLIKDVFHPHNFCLWIESGVMRYFDKTSAIFQKKFLRWHPR